MSAESGRAAALPGRAVAPSPVLLVCHGGAPSDGRPRPTRIRIGGLRCTPGSREQIASLFRAVCGGELDFHLLCVTEFEWLGPGRLLRLLAFSPIQRREPQRLATRLGHYERQENHDHAVAAKSHGKWRKLVGFFRNPLNYAKLIGRAGPCLGKISGNRE